MTDETNLTSRKLVRDLMTVGVPTCPPTTLLVELVRLMLEKNWEAVVVLDGDEGVLEIRRNGLERNILPIHPDDMTGEQNVPPF